MRFSLNVLALSALLFSSSVLAYEHNIDAIVARHELDNELEARGMRTEFETRALLVARAPPNGDCSTGLPQPNVSGPQCAQMHGYGWKFNGRCYGPRQMILQGNTVKGFCYF
ncbi:hypothetical protein JR316_0006262 [Psilocybe cubensis]|uniref:Uncharacterized protein n=2 Tax=Psilocybe cubensis TaxID=181762 RepID=A0ACB8H160_PSICU|nr:hypothetical protein JR316_0006262 [Psilocybe cubensis]KAH9481735.1 hypothetical protein JR316_0006262 [Psilocybe cubensis]